MLWIKWPFTEYFTLKRTLCHMFHSWYWMGEVLSEKSNTLTLCRWWESKHHWLVLSFRVTGKLLANANSNEISCFRRECMGLLHLVCDAATVDMFWPGRRREQLPPRCALANDSLQYVVRQADHRCEQSECALRRVLVISNIPFPAFPVTLVCVLVLI